MQVPLIGFIGRLDYQKGADLVLGAAHWLLNQDVQIICLGTGDKHLEVACHDQLCKTELIACPLRTSPLLSGQALLLCLVTRCGLHASACFIKHVHCRFKLYQGTW